jgi:hypothetical protein
VLPPAAELRVDEDFAVGTVAFESLDESVVRKLAFERLRSSLKNGMICTRGTISAAYSRKLGGRASRSGLST